MNARRQCCILSKFYIKPQHTSGRLRPSDVVSYRNSTSNHNLLPGPHLHRWVVSYRNSTSNHNMKAVRISSDRVVSYRNSTSNHNFSYFVHNCSNVVSYRNSTSNHNIIQVNAILLSVVSYRNSTSNHNWSWWDTACRRLYLIEILHQTTTSGLILIDKVLLTGCLPL